MKTVFFDIDTQIDFVYPAGALYVPGAERILPIVGELNRRAPVLISTMDAHSEDDPEFQIISSSLRGRNRWPAQARHHDTQ